MVNRFATRLNGWGAHGRTPKREKHRAYGGSLQGNGVKRNWRMDSRKDEGGCGGLYDIVLCEYAGSNVQS